MKSYYKYWGKTNSTTHHLLVYHCLDVGAVAWTLLEPTGKINPVLAMRTGLSPDTIRYASTLCFMLHDLGKFSKRFQALDSRFFSMAFPDASPKNYEIRHDTMGFLLWRGDGLGGFSGLGAVIAEINPILYRLLDYFIEAGFGHHGIPPQKTSGNLPLRATPHFDNDDISAATEFVLACYELIKPLPDMPIDPKSFKKQLRAISWQISGMGIMADWIGSNSDFFPYCPNRVSLPDYWNLRAKPQAVRAILKLGISPAQPASQIGLRDLFPFIIEPTPLQKCSEQIALFPGPKLFIIEDVTGAGKTETAMTLASRVMGMGDADGIYIGLPTMATANAMYDRMQQSYRKLFTSDDSPSLILAHGARHLSEQFFKTIAVAKQPSDKPYGIEETASAYCNQWFADNRKKALQADIGVGTIDQALIGILPARHQSLRLLGLQRKVLIVDEVHAYDAYMEHLLEVLLEAHAQGGGSAILLSATIPQKKRAELIKAFQAGLGNENPAHESETDWGFPLLTQVGRDTVHYEEMATRKTVERSVSTVFCHVYDDLLTMISEVVQRGQCVCWIRNTVRDARQTFHDLTQRGIGSNRIDLFHSRFAMIDRTRIENGVINNFGKESGPKERQGRVLVATQVVEQSLDLDFDVLISDLAPIDLLIQRAGRLHRHIRDQAGNIKLDSASGDERGKPVLRLFCPKFTEDADTQWLTGDFAGTQAVYEDVGVLWRTLRVLHEKQGWRMPEDARELIESVYGNGAAFDVPDGLVAKVTKAIGKDQAKEGMANLNALSLERGYCREAVKTGQWNEDEKIATRLSEDSEEIVLAVMGNGQLRPYADIESFGWDWSSLSVSLRDWKKTAYELPTEIASLEATLKDEYPRLKYSKIVLVDTNAGHALEQGKPISEVYDPRLGWGAEPKKEA